MTGTDGKVTVSVRLSQAEADALHDAVDLFHYRRVFNEVAQEMHEKVADALLAGGYDPFKARELP